MIDIDWKPSDAKLRQFAVASLVGFPLIGLLLSKLLPWFRLPAFSTGAAATDFLFVAALAGAAVFLLGVLIPRSIVPVYVILVALALPIGLALSFLLIPLIYYGVFTPIGLGLRLLGKDPMDRSMGRSDSYWIKRKPAPAAAQYYKQY